MPWPSRESPAWEFSDRMPAEMWLVALERGDARNTTESAVDGVDLVYTLMKSSAGYRSMVRALRSVGVPESAACVIGELHGILLLCQEETVCTMVAR